MKRTVIIITICVFSGVVNAQKNLPYIFFYDPITSLSETNLYEKPKGFFDFTEQYNNLKRANISADLARAIQHRDLRFIALSGKMKYLYPGVSPKEEVLIKQYKFKVIQGTGSMVRNKNAPPLQGVASAYASNYNKMLLLKIKAKH